LCTPRDNPQASIAILYLVDGLKPRKLRTPSFELITVPSADPHRAYLLLSAACLSPIKAYKLVIGLEQRISSTTVTETL
jgi:hypothetical protein